MSYLRMFCLDGTCSHPSMLDSIVASRLPPSRKGSPMPTELRLAVSRLMWANFSWTFSNSLS